MRNAYGLIFVSIVLYIQVRNLLTKFVVNNEEKKRVYVTHSVTASSEISHKLIDFYQSYM